MNDICTHPGCGRLRRTKKYCSTHYKRNRAGRDMDAPIATPVPMMDRFMSKVKRAPGGCLEWTGSTNGVGYGMFFTAWEHGKEIPAGLHLDHLCRNTMCVNPDHVRKLAHRWYYEQIRTSSQSLSGSTPCVASMSRQCTQRKTHCVNGHPFSGDNLMYRSNGRWRDCRECRRAKDRRRQAALKEK